MALGLASIGEHTLRAMDRGTLQARSGAGRQPTSVRLRGAWAAAWALLLVSSVTVPVRGSETAPSLCSLPALEAPRLFATGEDTLALESEHFVVTYVLSGRDSILHPDLPQVMLSTLEEAYAALSSDTGAGMRPPFGTVERGGGVRKILVSIAEVGVGFVGRAYAWPWIGAPCPNSAAGVILLDRGLDGPGLRRAATHELMHVFQYAVDPEESGWAIESTARWAENFVFPADRSLVASWASFVHHREAVWWCRNSTIYSPHFWDFLDRFLETDVPPAVWRRACNLDWLEALQLTLEEHATDLDQALHVYATWNYFTGERDDGAHYDLPLLPEIQPDTVFAALPVVGAAIPGAAESGSTYFFFRSAATRRHLRVQLQGSSAWKAQRRVSWVGTTGANTHSAVTDVDGTADAFVVPDWYQYDQVAVIVSNAWSGGTLGEADLCYAVGASEEGEPVADLVWRRGNADLRVPNPVHGAVPVRYRSSGAAGPTRVAIHDARGRLVCRLVDRLLPAGAYSASWDGRDDEGRAVASGVYVLQLQHASGSASRRFVWLR